ncbi:MAG: hypothetical protein HY288_15580 [Planctomycetia bacterium]|nr:hypothetical protein [Planctomycetia bacterium]
MAFHGYWAAAWLGLALMGLAALAISSAVTVGVAAYLGGLLFNVVGLDWMRAITRSSDPWMLFHWMAFSWPVAVLLMRQLPMPWAFPIAWTIGTAMPTWGLVGAFGPPGHFYMNRLAQTQVDLPLAQIADLAGMAGIEFVMTLVVAAVMTKRWMFASIIAGVVLIYAQVQHPSGELITVAINGGQLNMDHEFPTADISVWPEVACRLPFSDAQWHDLAHKLGGKVVCGIDRPPYNSAIVIGDEISYLNKRFLVMGGESPSPLEYVLGASHQICQVGETKMAEDLIVPICYEITVPTAIRQAAVIVNPGSELRLGPGRGSEAMLAHARLRAIEARRPVVRAVVSGYSAIINANGDADATIGPMRGQVQLDKRFSLYAVTGDCLAVVSCAIVGAVLVRRSIKSKNKEPQR